MSKNALRILAQLLGRHIETKDANFRLALNCGKLLQIYRCEVIIYQQLNRQFFSLTF